MTSACVEQIVEPGAGYLIANIKRSYDTSAGGARIIDERLTDLHPAHRLQSPCYASSIGYSRYVHTWAYDSGGRTVLDRLDDLGDGSGCSGDNRATQTETTWDFDDRGHLLRERSRHLTEARPGQTPHESFAETSHSYDQAGLLSASSYVGSQGSSSTSAWSYTASGQPLGFEQVYQNSNGERSLSSKSWEYDGAGRLLHELDRQSGPVELVAGSAAGSAGFFRVELRLFDGNGLLAEERIDHHRYASGSNSGPYGADGVYDSHTELAYDAAGGRSHERLIHDFLGGLVAEDNAWERDAEGRVIKETRATPGSSDFGTYTSREFSYGTFGLESERALDQAGRLAYEVRYVRDQAGRHLRTLRTSDGSTFVTLLENAYEYDADARVMRWRQDSDGNGAWDAERRYIYSCGVDFNRELGREVTSP